MRLWRSWALELDADDLLRYLAGDEDVRRQIVEDRLRGQFDELLADGEVPLGHVVIDNHQVEEDWARKEAAYLGISPDQYLWLSERLSQEEFEQISDEAMHQLLVEEYSEYPEPGEK